MELEREMIVKELHVEDVRGDGVADATPVEVRPLVYMQRHNFLYSRRKHSGLYI